MTIGEKAVNCAVMCIFMSPALAITFCIDKCIGSITWSVYACLTSMKDGIASDANTAALFEQLRETSPQVCFTGASSHTRQGHGANGQSTTETVTTFSGSWFFKYARWRDLSGTTAGLEKYSMAIISVVVDIESADQETKQALDNCKASILEYIRREHWDRDVTCFMTCKAADCSEIKVSGTKSMITRSPGVTQPIWMNKCLYFLCHMCCLGWLYRLCFAMHVPNIAYHLRKEVSVSESP